MSLLAGQRNQATVISLGKPTISTPRRAGEVCSNVKSMHTVSSDICKVVHYRSIQKGQTLNQHQHLMTSVERRLTKMTWNVEYRRLVLQGRRLIDIVMIQAKLLDALAKLLLVHITKCFKWCCNHWACCGHFQRDNTKLKVSLWGNSIQKLSDHTTHHRKSTHTNCWWLKQAFNLSNTQQGSRLVCRLGVYHKKPYRKWLVTVDIQNNDPLK